jgi:hypothetical protein
MNRQARRPASIAGTRLRGGFHERCDGAGNLRRLPATAAAAMRGIVQSAVDRLRAVVEDHHVASAIKASVPPGACLYVGAGCDREGRFPWTCAFARGDTDAETEGALIAARLLPRLQERCATPGWDNIEPWGTA